MSIIKCTEVLRVGQYGSSHPVIRSGSDGNQYFVKLNGGLSGRYGALSEWLCIRMAKAFQLPVIEPLLIEIKNESKSSALYIENRELVKKSLGLNLAFKYYPNVKPRDFRLINSTLAKRLFLFDLFILNMDRTEGNSNIILADKKIKFIDYESSLLIPNVIQKTESFSSARAKKQIRNHVFFNKTITLREFIIAFSILQKIDFSYVTDGFPDCWLGGEINKADLKNALLNTAKETHRYWDFYLDVKNSRKLS